MLHWKKSDLGIKNKQKKKLKLYRINCLDIQKGKLELSGADDNYKAIGGRKDVVYCFPFKKLST